MFLYSSAASGRADIRRERLDRRSGQMVIFVSLCLMVLITIVGFTVDLGYSYYVKVYAQTAADSAASAAAIYANTNSYSCGSSGLICNSTYSCPSSVTSVGTALQAGCVYAGANGFTNAGNQSVSLIANSSTAAAVPNETGNAPALWIQANVSQSVPHWFLYWAGFQSGSVSAQAISGVNVTPNSGCAYILDTGNTQDALNITGSGSFSAGTCAVNVWSSNSKALEVQGSSASLSSPANVHGASNCSGGAHCSPVPTTGVTVPSTTSTAFNPLINLPTPTFDSSAAGCSFGTNTTAYSVSSTPALPISHGTYCGGITVSGGTLTLNSGIYILNGGGLVVQGSGQISAANVMFFLTGKGVQSGHQGPLTLQGGNVSATAPASGTYQGILFFQDPSATYGGQNVVQGGVTVTGSGTWYFPNTTLTFSGSSSASAKMAFVVEDLTLSGSAAIAQDTTGIYTGLATRRPGLIQ